MQAKMGIALKLLFIISDKKRITRRELADRCSIHERTVTRYINILRDAGFDIGNKIGRYGCITLNDNRIFSDNYFTKEEFQLILNSLNAFNQNFSDKKLDDIILKLKNTSSLKTNTHTTPKNPTVYITNEYLHNQNFLQQKLPTIYNSIHNNTSLHIHYFDKFDTAQVDHIDPYTIVFDHETYYLCGMTHRTKSLSTIRLSRINSIQSTEKTFEASQDFNIKQIFEKEFDGETISIKLEFSNFVLYRIEEWLGKENVSTDGQKYTVTARAVHNSTLISKILSFGSDLKVISPASLKNEIVDEIRRMMSYNEM